MKRPKNKPSQFEKLGDFVQSVWYSTKLSNEQKATMIHDAALRLLNGEELPEENAPNAGGRLTAATLESDARKLMGRPAIVPRKLSPQDRQKLLAARARLTGESLGQDVLETGQDDDRNQFRATTARLDRTEIDVRPLRSVKGTNIVRKWDKIAADQAAADEIRDPGCTARKKAAHSRERMIRKARQSTEEQYRQLLTGIVQGKRPSPIKLTQLMTALSKSEQDVADDVELRAAEMEDEAEVIRCKDEKASLQKQIDEAEAAIREAEVAQTKSGRHYDELQEKIAAIHSKVALDEKRDLAKALSRNQSATPTIQQANDTIRELQNKMADVRPRTMSVARL